MDSLETRQILLTLRRLGGAARVSELSATRSQLSALTKQGIITRRGHGWISLADADPALELAARVNGVLSCVTLLHRARASVPGDEREVHISVPRNRGPSGALKGLPPGTVIHREDVPRSSHRRETTLEAATARAVRCITAYDDAVAVLDQAARLVNPGAIDSFVSGVLHRVARNEPGLAMALAIDSDPRARSAWETRLRLILRRAGLRVVPGIWIPGIGEVDLLVEGHIIEELDGWEYHRDRATFESDRARDRNAHARGSLTRRHVYGSFDPLREVAELRALLEQCPEPLPFASWVPERERIAIREIRQQAMAPLNRAVGAHHLSGRRATTVMWPK